MCDVEWERPAAQQEAFRAWMEVRVSALRPWTGVSLLEELARAYPSLCGPSEGEAATAWQVLALRELRAVLEGAPLPPRLPRPGPIPSSGGRRATLPSLRNL